MSDFGTIEFTTGTATFAVFDPSLLQHRLDDAADWWSVPWEEVIEINHGNMLTVALGTDGHYTVHLTPERGKGLAGIEAVIVCESGTLFIGAGEQLPAGGLQPSGKHGGRFLELAKGTYRATLSRDSHSALRLSLERVESPPQNRFDDSPVLKGVA
jgi:hypothetical protein